MPKKRFHVLQELLVHTFPERHLYVRSGGETKAYVFSTATQFVLAIALSFLIFWLTMSTGAVLFMAASGGSSTERQLSMMRAQSERLVADRQARLNDATKEFSTRAGSLDQMANMIEKRHGALIQILKEFKNVPGSISALTPAQIDKNLPAFERIMAVSAEQERMVSKAENLAKTRAERLRIAFRLAGLSPRNFVNSSLGGPLSEASNTQQLAALLDVDEYFADRIHNAATDLNDMRQLQKASDTIPFSRPTSGTRQTSGFGVRFDPFTRRPKAHDGLDFAGPYLTPIVATAPGIVSFVGIRNGYGKVVEIDHSQGFKTRFAHLASFAVSRGQRIGVGQRIASMGSTGRSTGVHLHYEVWINGRPQNPARFIKAGDYVQQN
jgi:murein DD-endopeptidase MepM/ murein hydrolase activator NlpD